MMAVNSEHIFRLNHLQLKNGWIGYPNQYIQYRILCKAADLDQQTAQPAGLLRFACLLRIQVKSTGTSDCCLQNLSRFGLSFNG